MGIYDREYFQEEERPSGFHVGGGQPMMITKLVVVTCGLFIVDLFMEGALHEQLRVQADVYRRPWEFWQLLSYGFAHGGFWHIALNMFMLWMFGRVVEPSLGAEKSCCSIWLRSSSPDSPGSSPPTCGCSAPRQGKPIWPRTISPR